MGNNSGKLEKESKKKRRSRRAKSLDLEPTREVTHSDTSAPTPFTRSYRGDNRPGGIKKYQSYSGNGSTSGQSPVEVKLYRRTIPSAPTGGRYQSLPRNYSNAGPPMGRSRSVTSSIYQSNGTLNGDPAGDHVVLKRYSMLHPPRLNDTRDSIMSSGTYAGSSYRGAGNTSYRVVSDDFPDTSVTKRRVSQFETQFAKCFVALYSRLSETVQLSAVSIALCLTPTGQHPISLYQYLTCEEIPTDLSTAQMGRSPHGDQYTLTIPQPLFHGVKHIRTQRIPDRRQWVTLARELVTCLAVEVAEEIARIFEYQIALLGDGLPIDLLARHAGECAIEYLKTGNRFLERNTFITGVLSGGARLQDLGAEKVISVVIGEKEYKWNLGQIFRKCGLRKEVMLFYPRTRDSTHFRPWTFHTSPECSPEVYGYRGIALDRDPVHGYYVVSREDETRFSRMAEDWNPDDIHRRYAPYRRLIGKEVMDEYCSVTKDNEDVTLAEYVLKLQGSEYVRDVIQPVYRPLGMISALPRTSRLGSSVSSLLSSDSTNIRASGRRNELHPQFPSAKKIHVTSTLVLRNPSLTPGFKSYSGPESRGFRSESCSIASEDVGYGRTMRDAPAGFGAPRFRGSATYRRPESLQPMRLYQSQRQPKSTSTYNHVPSHHQGLGSHDHPGHPGHLAREIPDTPASRDFLDFNAFLGMIRHSESSQSPGKMDGLTNGQSRPVTPGPVSPMSVSSGVFSSRLNDSGKENGHSAIYSLQMNGNMAPNNGNDLRRTAISHV